MLKETQTFRLSGTTDIAKIPVSLVQDSKVVLWEHIQLFFPKLVNVKKGDTGIPYKLDSNSINVTPLCIGYFPGDTLDVIVGTQDERDETSVAENKNTGQEPHEARRLDPVSPPTSTDFASVGRQVHEARSALVPLSSTQMRDPSPSVKAWPSNEDQPKSSNGAASLPWNTYCDKQPRVGGISQHSLPEETNISSSVSKCSPSTEVELGALNANANGDNSFGVAGEPQNHYENLTSRQQQADAGVAQAQYLLGEMYDKGEKAGEGEGEAGNLSNAPNLSKAFQWYLKAGNQGHVLAQRRLGNMYKHGHGVPEEYTKAQDWFKKAGDRGDDYSLMALAFMKMNGQGGPKDIGHFFELTGKALAPLLLDGRRFA